MKRFFEDIAMKGFWIVIMVIVIVNMMGISSFCAGPEVDGAAAILVEAETGTVLYEKNADIAYPPASVTKIMTALLVMEAIDENVISLEDNVQISENAAAMGGSQVYLAPSEVMSVEDLLKSMMIASANDSAVALAEYVAGSEDDFVGRMNERAAELGMVNTHFENTNGLDDTTENHITSARDIAIMSGELIKHDKILEYTSTWQDSIRDGAFTLTNTNRLIRFYNGANGLKTGSTSKAKYCISATAKRDGMQLIAVIMGSSTRDKRNESAKKLLDYGFANYSLYKADEIMLDGIDVKGSNIDKCKIKAEGFTVLLDKSDASSVQSETELPSYITAPVTEGEQVGRIVYTSNGKIIGESSVISTETVKKISFAEQFLNILNIFLI